MDTALNRGTVSVDRAPLASVASSSLADRRSRALGRCDEQIRWYDQHASWAWRLGNGFQVAVIMLGGLTPILLLWDSPAVPKYLLAIPSALAAIAAGIAGVFRWREDGVRYAYVRESLKSERLKYETRTTDEYGAGLNDERALDNFVRRVEQLAMAEVSDWRSSRLSEPASSNDSAGKAASKE